MIIFGGEGVGRRGEARRSLELQESPQKAKSTSISVREQLGCLKKVNL
jgi:hypothetical protein